MVLSEENARRLRKRAGTAKRGEESVKGVKECISRLESMGVTFDTLKVEESGYTTLTGHYSGWPVAVWLHGLPCATARFVHFSVVPVRVQRGLTDFGKVMLVGHSRPDGLRITINRTLDYALNREVMWK